MSTQVCGGVLLRDGAVLLGLRAAHKTVAPNTWDMAGGHVEPGETPHACLRRELMEELGVTVTDAKLHGTFHDAAHDLTVQVFVVTAWVGEPAMLGDEHTALRWFALADAAALPNLADEAYRALFRDLAAQA